MRVRIVGVINMCFICEIYATMISSDDEFEYA